MTDQPIPPSRARRWISVIVLTFCGYLAGYNVGKVSSSLIDIRDDLDLSLMLASSIASSYSTVAMLSAIILGLLVGRFGATAAVITGLSLTGLSAFAGVTTTTYEQLIASRVAEGIGFVLMAIAIPVLIARIIDEKSRPMAMGLWGTFIPGGVAMSMLVGLVFDNSWRPLWWFTCAMAIVCLLLIITIVLPVLGRLQVAEKATTAKNTALYPSVFSRDPLLLAASFLLYSSFFVSLITFLPTLLTESTPMELEAATRVSVFIVLCNICGNITAGFAISRGVRLKLLLTMALLGAGLFSSVVFLEELDLSVRVFFGLLACYFGGLLPASVFASVANFVPEKQSGLLLGIIFQAMGSGQVAGPLIMAAMVENLGGWRWGSVFYLGLAFGGLCLMAVFQSGKKV